MCRLWRDEIIALHCIALQLASLADVTECAVLHSVAQIDRRASVAVGGRRHVPRAHLLGHGGAEAARLRALPAQRPAARTRGDRRGERRRAPQSASGRGLQRGARRHGADGVRLESEPLEGGWRQGNVKYHQHRRGMWQQH